jgi:hypothetical protein
VPLLLLSWQSGRPIQTPSRDYTVPAVLKNCYSIPQILTLLYVCTTCLPYLCFASLSPCLLFHTCTTSHSNAAAPTGCSLPFAPYPGYRCASVSASTSLSQCSAVIAWHGFFLWFSLHVPPSRPLGRAWYYRTRFSLS